MREGMAEHGVVTKLFAYVRQGCRITLMETNGHAEFFERGPQRLVVGVVPGATVDQVRTEEDPTEAQLLDTALGLCNGVFNGKGRNHLGPDQPLPVGRTEVIQPVLYARAIAAARHGSRSGTVRANSPREG